MEVASRISPICRNLECSASDACDDALSGSDHRAGVNISCPAPVNSVNNFWPAIRGDLQTFANINTDILQSPMTAFDFSSTIGPIQKSLYMLLLYQFTFAQNKPKFDISGALGPIHYITLKAFAMAFSDALASLALMIVTD